MLISIVVAASEENAIGGNNALLWKLPNDMRFFKNLTWGMPVVMGRKTFESMASRPLPGRINIVISRNPSSIASTDNLWVAASLEEAIDLAKTTDCREAFIIGGGEIYQQSMGIAGRIYLTRVYGNFTNADAFFPLFSRSEFTLIEAVEMPADEKHAHAYTFETWQRLDSTTV